MLICIIGITIGTGIHTHKHTYYLMSISPSGAATPPEKREGSYPFHPSILTLPARFRKVASYRGGTFGNQNGVILRSTPPRSISTLVLNNGESDSPPRPQKAADNFDDELQTLDDSRNPNPPIEQTLNEQTQNKQIHNEKTENERTQHVSSADELSPIESICESSSLCMEPLTSNQEITSSSPNRMSQYSDPVGESSALESRTIDGSEELLSVDMQSVTVETIPRGQEKSLVCLKGHSSLETMATVQDRRNQFRVPRHRRLVATNALLMRRQAVKVTRNKEKREKFIQERALYLSRLETARKAWEASLMSIHASAGEAELQLPPIISKLEEMERAVAQICLNNTCQNDTCLDDTCVI